MERLTKRELVELKNGEEIVACNYKDEDCNDSCIYGRCRWNHKALKKLKEYEDLEEQLEKVYGEHDGLLETVVKSLVKYNGERPRKARLLTDEDADRWEEYKRLEEQGLLLRLLCAKGTTVYEIEDDCEFNGDCYTKRKCKGCEYRYIHIEPHILGTNAQVVMEMNNFGKTVFLTKEAAEAALKEMEK